MRPLRIYSKNSSTFGKKTITLPEIDETATRRLLLNASVIAVNGARGRYYGPIFTSV